MNEIHVCWDRILSLSTCVVRWCLLSTGDGVLSYVVLNCCRGGIRWGAL